MSSSLLLRPVLVPDKASFIQAVNSFADSDPDFHFAFSYQEDVDFAAYCDLLACWSRGEKLTGKLVPSSFLVGVINDQIVGRVSIRHKLNEFLATIGGHVGYGVCPDHRGKGYATEMLRQALIYCREQLGLTKVLITCDTTNHASARVIEKNGGVFQDLFESDQLKVPKRRYWVAL